MQRGLLDYVADCTIHAAQTYDIIFTMPYGVLAFEEEDLRKSMPAHQMTIQMMIEHAVYLGFGIYIVHQIQSVSLEERVEEVLKVIEGAYKQKKDYKPKVELSDEIESVITRTPVPPKLNQ